MNHLRPGLSSVTRSSPELQTEVAAALLHALKSGPLSSTTLWELLLYLNAAKGSPNQITFRCMAWRALNETKKKTPGISIHLGLVCDLVT